MPLSGILILMARLTNINKKTCWKLIYRGKQLGHLTYLLLFSLNVKYLFINAAN